MDCRVKPGNDRRGYSITNIVGVLDRDML